MNRKLNILLILVVVLLIAMLITVRSIFSEKHDVFTNDIKTYEVSLLEDFNKLKQQKIDSISHIDNKVVELFNEQFDENLAIINKDTSITYIYLTKKLNYKDYSTKYIDCLINKCSTDKKNGIVLKEIESKEKRLQDKFGETHSMWYPKMKDQLIVNNKTNTSECSKFFPDCFSISYDNDTWNDFEKFMTAYNSEIKKVDVQNKNNEWQLTNNTNSTKRQLNKNAILYFDKRLSSERETLLKNTTETRTYNCTFLGDITYEVNVTRFNYEAFQNIADKAFEEHWKSNSLWTGATPYSNCYGSSDNCNGWNCSQIKVLTSSRGGDVIVTVKNIYGKVVRHVYIKTGNSYTFDVPDGRYQVFFYSGTGWNPNKSMSSSSCSSFRGGFVTNESVTKDDYIHLNSQIMTYELIMQQNGNFSTKPSSKGEAF